VERRIKSRAITRRTGMAQAARGSPKQKRAAEKPRLKF
jgi:hypothetical protein